MRTPSEGKGPANAEWQLIMPHRYISICPRAQYLPLRARRRHRRRCRKHAAFCCKPAAVRESASNGGLRGGTKFQHESTCEFLGHQPRVCLGADAVRRRQTCPIAPQVSKFWVRFSSPLDISPAHQIRIRDLAFTSAERDISKQVTHNLIMSSASSDSESCS